MLAAEDVLAVVVKSWPPIAIKGLGARGSSCTHGEEEDIARYQVYEGCFLRRILVGTMSVYQQLL
jgi:hypothetical protein